MEGKSKKFKLEEFLKIEKSLIIKRLSLIKLIIPAFNPDEKYAYLKKTNDKINEDMKKRNWTISKIILYYITHKLFKI